MCITAYFSGCMYCKATRSPRDFVKVILTTSAVHSEFDKFRVDAHLCKLRTTPIALF